MSQSISMHVDCHNYLRNVHTNALTKLIDSYCRLELLEELRDIDLKLIVDINIASIARA